MVLNKTRIGFMFFALLIAVAHLASAQQLSRTGGSPSVETSAALNTTNQQSTSLIAVPEDFSTLKIGPGFLLDIRTYDEPDLSGQLRVDESGNIAFPLAGQIHVGGCTLDQARQRIQKKLFSAQILLHPQVTINIEQYAPFIVAIMGEVRSPGRVRLLAPHSLLDVLSQVGGETAMAGDLVQIRHTQHGKTKTDSYAYARDSDGKSIEHVMVHAGDTVIVPRAGIVYVLGAVHRPGGYLMQENGGLNVAQALSLAAGTTLQAAVGSIRVLRRGPDGTLSEHPVDYKAIAQGKETPLPLQPQDIVYVPVSKTKSIFTNGSSLINEAAYSTVYAVR